VPVLWEPQDIRQDSGRWVGSTVPVLWEPQDIRQDSRSSAAIWTLDLRNTKQNCWSRERDLLIN
jgi:hypothetical protein